MSEGTTFGITVSSGTATLCWLTGDGTVTTPETVNLARGDARGVARELADMVRVRRNDVVGLGVAIGGHVAKAHDAVTFAPQLVTADENWFETPIAELLREAMDLPDIYIENDVNCMVEQQRSWGAAQSMDSFAVVYLAPEVIGLGCGICVDGTVLTGVTGGAGEIGHLVVQPNGPRCRCGNRGCLQAVLSAENLVREVNWGNQGQLRTLKDIRTLADSGHAVARRAFKHAGTVLGVALANLINLVDPGDIILGGAEELVQSRDEVFVNAMQESLEKYSFSNLGISTRIWVEPLNAGTAAQGAAKLAYDAFVTTSADKALRIS
jgi:predicted NBD/HSP70 family sugar kinase